MSSTSKTKSDPKLHSNVFLAVSKLQLVSLTALLLLVIVAGVVAYQKDWLPVSWGPQADHSEVDVASNQTILPVNVQRIHFVDSIEQSRRYTGVVRARRSSELAFEITGKISEVLIDDGEQVEAGQVIAKMDVATLMAQRAATLASLEQCKYVMEELTAGPRDEQIAAAVAEAAAAKSEYDNAVIRSKRRRALVAKKAIPVEEYEQSKFDVQGAKARWQSTVERMNELQAGTRQERISAQQATVAKLEAEVKEVEIAIGKSSLVAPYAGTITKRFLDPGSIVQPSNPICKLVEQDKLEAWIGVPVDVAAQVTVGQQYIVDVGQASYDVTASAKIKELDISTRTQAVLFEFAPETTQAIVAGQLCRINITTEVNTSGFWVPNTAVTRGVRGLSSLMTLAPDVDQPELYRVRRCDIEVIKTDASRMLVKGTIVDGDLVVADGLHRVTGGQLVSLAEVLKPVDDLIAKPPAL